MEIESTDRDLRVQERYAMEFVEAVMDLQVFVRSTPKGRSMVVEDSTKI